MINANEDILYAEMHKRVLSISAEFDGKLKELQGKGVITDLDRQKLFADAKISGEAIIRSLRRNDIPYGMKRELVERLIENFTLEVNKILKEVQQRLYTTKRIESHLSTIETEALSVYNVITFDSLISSYGNEIQSARLKVINNIQEIFHNTKNNISDVDLLINNILQSYKQFFESIVKRHANFLASQHELTPTPQKDQGSASAQIDLYKSKQIEKAHNSIEPDDKGVINTLKSLFERSKRNN